ncbi:MAG: orotate phosphoribosyltransferase [Candidatus Marinimicrobia bacterium]|jgi:orotate phosphoribosyltransferase|nr:orotate phosphoribosyltransferase [Candidatus Neomarinimicrobiota bacterium]MDP6835764.1 orotate phosphoribosyltransferase [Candidatus Neomarinimicrobiota bacterium]|tara:strand:+ start:706 stop:1272 length:567 start_codon:yes stop_codon:yes gene_type:complete
MSELIELMKETGAILEGHFRLTSARHSDVYIEKFRLLERPDIVEEIGAMMAEPYSGEQIEVVFGAAIGGILLSSAAARKLGTKGIFAERSDGELALRRGFHIDPGTTVLVVEDIVTTGGSVRELLQIAEDHGATVAGVACLADRTERGVDFGCPTTALVHYPAVSWEPDACPLCMKDVPLTTRGRTGK